MNELKKILKFFEDFSLEEQLHWSINPVASSQTLELRWQRDGGLRPWQIRVKNSQTWHYFDAQSFIDNCQLLGIDFGDLKSTLSQTALQQASFAQLMYKKANSLFGEDTILEMCKKRDGFLDKLSDTIEASRQQVQITSKKAKRSLRVIEGLGTKL